MQAKDQAFSGWLIWRLHVRIAETETEDDEFPELSRTFTAEAKHLLSGSKPDMNRKQGKIPISKTSPNCHHLPILDVSLNLTGGDFCGFESLKEPALEVLCDYRIYRSLERISQ